MLLLWRIEYENLLVITRDAAVSKLYWYIYSNLVNTRELYNITYIRPLFFEPTRFCDFCFFFVQRKILVAVNFVLFFSQTFAKPQDQSIRKICSFLLWNVSGFFAPTPQRAAVEMGVEWAGEETADISD